MTTETTETVRAMKIKKEEKYLEQLVNDDPDNLMEILAMQLLNVSKVLLK